MKKKYFFALLTLFLSVTMTAQIEQVTDINKTGDSGIGEPYAWNGVLYFEADAGDKVADELYVYDGDSAYLLADINVDTADNTPNSDPKYFIEFNGKLYFNANGGDYTGSDQELYETDGTTEGTKLTYDFNIAAKKAGNPMEFFIFNGKLNMDANNGAGTQIWSYDGENDPVKITNERDGGYFTPYSPMVDGEQVWLKGIASNSKYQLWKLTADTITAITDNNSASAYTGKGTPFNGGFIFAGSDEDKDTELWFSDGTAEGTSLLLDIDTASASKPEQFITYNDEVYFIASIDSKSQLWVSNATADGTQVVYFSTDTIDVNIDNLTLYDDKLFFTLTTQEAKTELWVFDGATSSKVSTIGASPKGFIEVDNLLFFIADGKLWCTEGYEDVTQMVDSLFEVTTEYASAADEYAIIGTKLYFTADDTSGYDDIYMIDASTIERKYTPIVLNDIKSLHVYNDEIYFEAEDQNNNIGDELYKQAIDGTISLVADINQDPDDSTPNSDPKYFIEFNGKLYFNANGGDYTGSDQELYETDGTTEGTKLTYDFNTAAKKAGNPVEFFIFDGKLNMDANDGAATQIWSYDGENDPIKITDERDGGYFTPYSPMVDGEQVWLKGIASNSKYQLWKLTTDTITAMTYNSSANAYTGKGTPFNGGFIFAGSDEEKDTELWYSDGTAEGTSLLLDIDTAAASKPEQFIEFNDKVYFIATINGISQVWESDATIEGTVATYIPEDTIDIDNLNIINNKVIFTAVDSTGYALYKLSSEGAEILARVGDSPEDFYEHDGLLFFVAGDSLWYTEGTVASTMAVPAELFEDGAVAQNVDGGEFVSIGTVLYFVAEADGLDVIASIDATDIERDPEASSIKENEVTAEAVLLFPMPTTGSITITADQSFSSYKVFDLSMKEVAASKLDNNTLNVSLKQGIYILQLQGTDSTISKKIIIK